MATGMVTAPNTVMGMATRKNNSAILVEVRYGGGKKLSILGHLRAALAGLVSSWSLGKQLAVRNFKASLRGSFLGGLWLFVPALATAVIWIYLRGNGVVSTAELGVPYPFFVLSGVMMWQVFVDSFNAPLRQIQVNKSVLAKLNFPREGLWVSAFLEQVPGLLVRCILLLIFFPLFEMQLSASFLWVVPMLVGLALIGLAYGLLVTPLGALTTDVTRVIAVALPFLMFLAPVIFPLPFEGPNKWLYYLNPAAAWIGDARMLMTGAEPGLILVSSFHLALAIFWALFALSLNRIVLPIVLERLGN